MANAGNAGDDDRRERFREESYLKLGFFDGTEDAPAVRAFLAKLEGIQQAQRYTDEAMAGMVKYTVRGVAARWMDNLLRTDPAATATWTDLLPVFRERWLRPPTGNQIFKTRADTVQKDGMGVQEFFDVVQAAVLKSHETMHQDDRNGARYPNYFRHSVLQDFVAGLKPIIQEKVSIHAPATPAAALRHAIAAEEALVGEELKKYKKKESKSTDTKAVASVDSAPVNLEEMTMEQIVEAVRYANASRGRGKGRGNNSRGRGGGGNNSGNRPGAPGAQSYASVAAQGQPGQNSGGGGRGRGRPSCWQCGEGGHMMSNCPMALALRQQYQRATQVRALDYQPPPAQHNNDSHQDGTVHHPFQ